MHLETLNAAELVTLRWCLRYSLACQPLKRKDPRATLYAKILDALESRGVVLDRDYLTALEDQSE